MRLFGAPVFLQALLDVADEACTAGVKFRILHPKLFNEPGFKQKDGLRILLAADSANPVCFSRMPCLYPWHIQLLVGHMLSRNVISDLLSLFLKCLLTAPHYENQLNPRTSDSSSNLKTTIADTIRKLDTLVTDV